MPQSKRSSARSPTALKNGDTITFTGFGKFTRRSVLRAKGVNPRTGEKVEIQAATCQFTAGSQLKKAVN